MRNLFSIVALMLVALYPVKGQDNPSGIIDYSHPKLAFKYSPLTMLEIEPSIDMGLEYKLKNNITMNTFAAYITTFGQTTTMFLDDVEMEGFRLRHEIRFYPDNSIDGGGFYIAPEAFYKYVERKEIEDIYNYEYMYNELIDYKRKKMVFGTNIKIGYQIQLFTSPILLDLFTGLGIRYINISTNEQAVLYGSDSFMERLEGNYITPTFNLGARMGVIIKK